jgi:hypothetical protein
MQEVIMGNKAIEKICEEFCSFPDIDMLWNFGPSDEKVDLLVLMKDGDIAIHGERFEKALLNIFCDGEVFFCDDSVRFRGQSISGGVAVMNTSETVSRLSRWSQGRNLGGSHRPWAVGYWIPEAFYRDLSEGKILYDASGLADSISAMTKPYPKDLRKALLILCREEVSLKMEKAEKFLACGGGNDPELRLCVSDISLAIIRFAFANSRRYLPGFSRLKEQSEFLSPKDKELCNIAFAMLSCFSKKHVLEVKKMMKL